MILTVGFWSSFQIRTFSGKIEKMLKNNDRSIQYAIKMNESLSKIDNAVLLKTQGDTINFYHQFKTLTEEYWQNYEAAKNNITEPGESEVLITIKSMSDSLFILLKLEQNQRNLVLYIKNIFPLYERIQANINKLRTINSDALYRNALSLVDYSKRVALPGDILVATAMLFFILFAWLTQKYIAMPIHRLLQALQKRHKTGVFLAPELETKDELAELVKEITELTREK
jgi:methyl-accepting chemotaxis protein